jgi:hypothetical protein
MAKIEKIFEKTINQMNKVEVEEKKSVLATRLTAPYMPIS